MSRVLINEYLGEIQRLKRASGEESEQIIREAFKDLLKRWSRQKNLILIVEKSKTAKLGNRVRPDGTILYESLRLPFGYWEAKDPADDLDKEIQKKLRAGYPQMNIIFENSREAVLWQDKEQTIRCDMTDVHALGRLLDAFFRYEIPQITEFNKAVDQFATDLPAILDALRDSIATAYAANPGFQAQAARFLTHAKDTINPTLTEEDVREMLIQHILTEDIFTQVFNDGQYHRMNNVAIELTKLENAFFTGAVRKDSLTAMQPYYAAIRANAAQISSHAEKQGFLKRIYEQFYKVYNPKAADRLGVVYTPNEIVRFMIQGCDWLCEKHFGKALIDHGVEILDPATGTGTFICELIDHFQGQPDKLRRKYEEELHANEVAILPYYVANLNIEATYATVAGGNYKEFQGLCFVDTLDNVAGLGIKAGYQHDLFAALSEENIERVKRQNKRKISVVIGNPPYNANQQNENDNNKNRAYPKIDDLIKRSFVKLSTAQKTKVYDMYARFFRWAFDRVHDDGIIAFVTNRSFIDSRTFDGFRRYVQENFAECWVVDLGGDVRANPKLSGTKNNVFGIQTGVAISFMVKRRGAKQCVIRYIRRPEFDTAEDKLQWLGSSRLNALEFERVEPDKAANWINLTHNDWDDLIPLADKKTKAAKTKGQERAVFKLFSLGLVTARDEWVYDRQTGPLWAKASYLIDEYEAQRNLSLSRGDETKKDATNEIKWTRAVKNSLSVNRPLSLRESKLIDCLYRPFDRRHLVFYPPIIEVLYQNRAMFGDQCDQDNQTIVFTDPSSQKPFMVLGSNTVVDLHLVGAATGSNCLPRYRYSPSGERIDNITDWALKLFRDRYGKAVTKDQIFAYAYAALHDPLWRETYAQNLKREFPRIPLHADFAKWVGWGERLLALHIGYEAVAPWPVVRRDTVDEKSRKAGVALPVVLKSDPAAGEIRLDSETVIGGIPPLAWEYRLGNRAALDWICDQYREKRPKDPTIREKFDTYRFADHKEAVAGLIARVARVSVETLEIVAAMRAG